MPRTLFGAGTVASAVVLLIAAAVPALADDVTADIDLVTAGNNLVITDCANGVTRNAKDSTGQVKVTSQSNGASHFRANQTLQVTQSGSPSGLTLASLGTLSTPASSSWGNGAVITSGIKVTVPQGTASGTFAVAVTVSGMNQQDRPLSLTAAYSVVVDCPSDNTPPALSLPANITTEATGASTAVTWTATAADAVSGNRPVTCTPPSGSGFVVGTTTVICSATDAAGNTASGSFTVTVRDTTAPAVTVPAPVFAEATSAAGAVVTFSASASDLVDGPVAAACLPAFGSTFALGSTQVTCTATDAASNTGSNSFAVTVGDSTAPVVTVPADMAEEATGPAGAVVEFESSAIDTVDGDLVPDCVPPSASTFALGNTSVTCSAKDAAGNLGSNDFSVSVVDTTAPALSGTPATRTVEATGPDGAPVDDFALTAADLVDGAVDVTCLTDEDAVVDAAFTYPLDAATKVICSATDAAGNTVTADYTVTVVDTTGPELAVPADITVEADSAAGTAVTFLASAIDVVDGDVVPDCQVQSGDVFPIGTTMVTCTASDAHGNDSDTISFTITVEDTIAPIIATHGAVTAEATSAAGALVGYTSPGTSDAVDGAKVASCLPASGSQFALGTTTVTCDAVDAAGNEAVATTFDVTVEDTTAPAIAPAAGVTAEATSAAGALVSYTSPATSDAVDGARVASCLPASGSQFALGTTTVTCNASDGAGNAATPTTFGVTVSDTTAPAIAPRGPLALTATSAAGAVGTYTAPATSDLVDGAGTATCLPASGSTFPVGTSTVSCSATDTAGNTSTTTFPVTVSFGWHGFFQPIDTVGGNGKDSVVRAGTVFNKAKAGSAIPVKFDLSGNMGLNVFAVGYPKTLQVACPSAALFDAIEETSTATTSGLKYDAVSGQYNYTWKTASNLASTCQRLEVKLVDGASYYAFFQLAK